MKEVDEKYHYSVWVICNECRTYKGQGGQSISLQHYKSKQDAMKNRMRSYCRVKNSFRFKCQKCGKILYVKVYELEEEWEDVKNEI